MKYQLRNTSSNIIIRTQDFEGDAPVLAEAKKLVWEVYVAPEPVPIPLDDLKQYKHDEINQARDYEEEQGFEYLSTVFDSDSRSVQRISIAAQAASLDENFIIPWVAKDNSVVMLNQSAMLQMPVALALHAYALHTKATILKEQVAIATTSEEVAAIKWDD